MCFSVEMMYKSETVPYWHVGEWVEFTGGQRYLKPTSPDSQGRAPTLMPESRVYIVPYWHVGEWVEFTGGQRYLKPTSPDSQGRAPTLMPESC